MVLLYDESATGTCYLGLGCKKSIELGGQLSEFDVFSSLEKFTSQRKWTFGWMGYDLKNTLYNLETEVENELVI